MSQTIQMECDIDIIVIAQTAIDLFGKDAIAVVKRRAAEKRLTGEMAAAEYWQSVAHAADMVQNRRTLH